jgi:hypothetical protein
LRKSYYVGEEEGLGYVVFGLEKVLWRALAAAVPVLIWPKTSLLRVTMISFKKDGSRLKKGCKRLLPEWSPWSSIQMLEISIRGFFLPLQNCRNPRYNFYLFFQVELDSDWLILSLFLTRLVHSFALNCWSLGLLLNYWFHNSLLVVGQAMQEKMAESTDMDEGFLMSEFKELWDEDMPTSGYF